MDKIRVFDIKFKNKSEMEEKPIIIEVDEDEDVNTAIEAYFQKNYGSVPSFDWEYVEESSDPNDVLEEIRGVLRKYFEEDDKGHDNSDYDPYFSAQDAIDEIHDIVGDI